MAAGPHILQLTACPECGAAAEVVDRHVLESTTGPVEHIRIRCVATHVFNLPVAMVDTCRQLSTPGSTPTAAPSPDALPGPRSPMGPPRP